MTHFLFGFFVLVLSLHVQAFQYRVEANSLLKSSPLQAYEFSKWFEAKGYRALSSRSVLSNQLPFDFAYAGPMLEKALLVKSGLRVPTDNLNKVIVDSKSQTIAVHLELEGVPYLILAVNISKDEVRELLKPWLVQKQQASWKWHMFFGANAHAGGVWDCGVRPMTSGLANTASFIESNELLQSVGRCGAQALQGASSSVKSSLDFFKKLAINPSALWSEMKDSFVELKEFALNIQNEIGPAIDAVSGLSSEQKAQMICAMTGQMVASAAQAFVSGAALAKALPLMILKLKQTAGALAKMAELEKRGIFLANKSKLADEVIACGL